MGNKVGGLKTTGDVGHLYTSFIELDNRYELMIYRESIVLSHCPGRKPSVKILRSHNYKGKIASLRCSHYDKKLLRKIEVGGPFPAWDVIAKEIQAVFGSQRLLLRLSIDIGQKKRRWTNKAAMDIYEKVRQARAAAKEADGNPLRRKFFEKLEKLYLIDVCLSA
jgi:hypothetical protein